MLAMLVYHGTVKRQGQLLFGKRSILQAGAVAKTFDESVSGQYWVRSVAVTGDLVSQSFPRAHMYDMPGRINDGKQTLTFSGLGQVVKAVSALKIAWSMHQMGTRPLKMCIKPSSQQSDCALPLRDPEKRPGAVDPA